MCLDVREFMGCREASTSKLRPHLHDSHPDAVHGHIGKHWSEQSYTPRNGWSFTYQYLLIENDSPRPYGRSTSLRTIHCLTDDPLPKADGSWMACSSVHGYNDVDDYNSQHTTLERLICWEETRDDEKMASQCRRRELSYPVGTRWV